MRYTTFYLFAILAFALGGGQPLFAQNISLSVWQNGVEIKSKEAVVKLDKKQFDLAFVFDKKVDVIFLNASYTPLYYDVKDNEPIPGLQNFFGFSVAEYPFNLDRMLIIDPETLHNLGAYYVYRGNKMHNFATLRKKGNKYYGLREVDKFDDRSQAFSIESITQPIYLYVVGLKRKKKKAPNDVSWTEEEVVFRWKVKIEWNN